MRRSAFPSRLIALVIIFAAGCSLRDLTEYTYMVAFDASVARDAEGAGQGGSAGADQMPDAGTVVFAILRSSTTISAAD